jgi:hypothetical protein
VLQAPAIVPASPAETTVAIIPVSRRSWNALYSTHGGATCVLDVLTTTTTRGLRLDQVLERHAADIRRCAASLHFSLED